MLSLLAAAQDYQTTFERFFQTIQNTRDLVLTGQLDPSTAIQSLALNARPEFLLQFPYDSPSVIRLEVKHFAKERRRNDRKKQKLRENRVNAAMGLPTPDRGKGGDHGWKGGHGAGTAALNITPDISATAGTAVHLPAPASHSHQPFSPSPDLSAPRFISQESIDAAERFDQQQRARMKVEAQLAEPLTVVEQEAMADAQQIDANSQLDSFE